MAVIELNTIPPKEIAKGYAARFIHTNTMTFSYLDVKAGSVIAAHSHMHEQVSHILEGVFQLTIDDEPIVFQRGTVVTIPSNAVHSGLAITDCKIIDVFSPVREDYKNML